jgi:phospholipase C
LEFAVTIYFFTPFACQHRSDSPNHCSQGLKRPSGRIMGKSRYICLGVFLFAFALIMSNTGCGGAASSMPLLQANATQPTPAAPTVTLTANPLTIDAGQVSTLGWSSTNATSISISPPVPGDDGDALPPSGVGTVGPLETTPYTATASGPGGTVTATVIIKVNPAKPKINLTATPSSLLPGQTATLSWTAQFATSIAIDNGVGAVEVPTGSRSVKPVHTTTYTATASGPGGKETAFVAVEVTTTGELGITITPAPKSVALGQHSVLTWASQNAARVTIDQGIGTVALSGSANVAPEQTTVYTATATDTLGKTVSATAMVTVVPPGGLEKLKHIIFMLQENRSFDHYFGRLGVYRESKGLPNEIDATAPDVTLLDIADHPVQRFHLPTTCIEVISPAWNETHYAVHDGRMDYFLKSPSIASTIDPHYTRAMGYYDERDIPFYYDVATTFATSDRFFSSVQAGTIPNRMYSFAATSAGRIHPYYENDPYPAGSWPQKTIFQLLDESGTTWRYYYQDDSVFLAYFRYWKNASVQAKIRPLDELRSILASPTADQDLPAVIFIQHGPIVGTDEHPGNPSIQIGATLVKGIVEALISSTAWPSSVFVLSWDEAGGFYEHVPPAPMPKPDDIAPIYSSDKDIRADFDESGLRLPLLVISPWVRPHHVSHTPREFTSILKLIEVRFGLPALTRRDAAADDMLEFFDFSSPQLLNPPPFVSQPTDGACNWSIEVAPTHPR